MLDPKNGNTPDPEKNKNNKKDINNFIDKLKKSAQNLNESAEKMRNIANIQKNNSSKLDEMNDKIRKAMKRLEEVRKRLANARLNQLNDKLKNQAQKKNTEPPKVPDHPKTLFISKSELILNKINKRSLKEFTDFVEFLKFNRMKTISDEEINSYDIDGLIKRLLT